MLTDTMDLIETINALKNQECSSYLTESGLYDQKTRVDGKCRQIIAAWCKQLAAYYSFKNTTVAIAVNMMDRFVAKEPELLNDAKANIRYRLVAMACLYSAIKTHEQIALDPKAISKLSRGVFSPKDIEQMELRILTTLGFRVNAPTPYLFAEMYLRLLPSHLVNERQREIIEELINCQIDCAIEDAEFLGMAASEIAFTSTFNATVATIGYHPLLETYGNIQETVDVNLLPFHLQGKLLNHIGEDRAQFDSCFEIDSSSFSTNVPMEKAGKGLRRSPSKQHLSPRCITMSQR